MIAEFEKELASTGKSPHTVRAYVERVRDFLVWLTDRYGEEDPTAITALDVKEYQAYCLNVKKYVPSGIGQRLAAVRAYCGFLQAKGILRDNPARSVQPVKTVRKDQAPDVLSTTELNRLRREVYRGGNIRDVAMMELLLQTGVRVSELVAVELDDITLTERKGTLRIRSGKGGKYREVPLSLDARKALSDYLQVRPAVSDARLFQGQRGPVTANGVWQVFKKYAARVGLKDKVHPHLFRHQFATELVRNKKQDLALVAELLGHASLNTTAVYTRPTAQEKAKAVENLFE